MNINIILTTESGSRYELWQKDGKLFFRKGYMLTGEIINLKEEIKIGGKLHIDFYREGIYGTYYKDAGFLKSSPITNIVIR